MTEWTFSVKDMKTLHLNYVYLFRYNILRREFLIRKNNCSVHNVTTENRYENKIIQCMK